MLKRGGPAPESLSAAWLTRTADRTCNACGQAKVISIVVRSQLSVGGDESGHLPVSAYLSTAIRSRARFKSWCIGG